MQEEVATDTPVHQDDVECTDDANSLQASGDLPLDPAKFTARLDHMVGDIR